MNWFCDDEKAHLRDFFNYALKRKTLRRFDLRGAGRHFGDARLSGVCRMSRVYIYPGLFDVVLILLLMLQGLLGVCGDDDHTDKWVGRWTLEMWNGDGQRLAYRSNTRMHMKVGQK